MTQQFKTMNSRTISQYFIRTISQYFTYYCNYIMAMPIHAQ